MKLEGRYQREHDRAVNGGLGVEFSEALDLAE
jgi:hypothetical protein